MAASTVVRRAGAGALLGSCALLASAACETSEVHFERRGPGMHAAVDSVPDAASEADAGARLPSECTNFPRACDGLRSKCTLRFVDPSEGYRSACLEPSGEHDVAERCTRSRPGYDDCSAGNFCSPVGLGLSDGDEFACRALCSSAVGCEQNQRCLKVNGGDFGVCLDACQVFDTSCEVGARCVAGSDVAGRYFGYCAIFGLGAEGDACIDDVNCGAALACEQVDKACRVQCDTDHPCPADRRCVPLGLGDPQSPRLCVP